MLDSNNRLALGKNLISKVNFEIEKGKNVHLFFDRTQKIILVSNESECSDTNMYYFSTQNIDTKGRLFIPKVIRDIFPEAAYLPTEKNGKMYILII